MTSFLNVFHDREDQLLQALLEHLQLSLIALLIAVFIGIPLGVYITRHIKVAEMVLGIIAIIQTIPSLALLGLLIPLVGIGSVPAIIALVVYALLPILRNTYTGIRDVDSSLIEAANAMGMSNNKRLTKVELPLAMPVIMAGIRTAMVLIVGTATLSALIGAGGLGDLILLGIDRNDNALILIGAIPAALLAIFFDWLLRLVEKLSFKRAIQTVSAAFIIVAFIAVIPYMHGSTQKPIVIAGKLGSEPEILINMYKLMIEQDTDIPVHLKPGLGKTTFVFNALKSDSIDIYPEFTGTAVETFLKEHAVSHSAEEVYNQAKVGLDKKYHMTLLKPMQFSDTYALAIPGKMADMYQIKTISDLKKVESSIKPGFTLEFTDRSDGYKGIQKTYGLHFSDVKTMEPKLRYAAVKKGDINLVDAYSTDSDIKQNHLIVLRDDKQLFPPYQGAPLIKTSTLQKYPELKTVLNKLAGKITDTQMLKMNYEVNVQGKSAESVARNYLKQAGLLKN
ncbi:ABC transporter permease subunit [Terrilactibacillus sp. BCM23-1]|uniref:Probable ergothioneine transporter EgtUBC n=1 Tax=Terrilactibacillus tamarindi TaxID=2599694 RepID=A0A6N8CN24_9BACI|nr:ABC transporter permease/substrate-binding protein [Terrilactibacillus tamarindi]MTT31331.1 ABC transporter permease subunit [Terrilactibacillus tamarindi]